MILGDGHTTSLVSSLGALHRTTGPYPPLPPAAPVLWNTNNVLVLEPAHVVGPPIVYCYVPK